MVLVLGWEMMLVRKSVDQWEKWVLLWAGRSGKRAPLLVDQMG